MYRYVTHSLQLVPFATRAFEMENGILKELTGSRNNPVN
jgi:hypothetical protein